MKCLILSGGAEKGIGYIGVVKYLEELKYLSSFETFYGTSVGAIVSTLISIGYTSLELDYIVKKMNIKDLILTDKHFDLTTFLETFGFFEPSKLVKLIELLIKKKTGIDKPTFLDLYKKYGKTLIITGSCISEYRCHYFNHINTPNMYVIDALRISISIPMLFKPVLIDGKMFVDGALYDNFPILHALEKYQQSDILGCLINLIFKMEDKITNIDTYLKVCMRSISIKMNQFTTHAYRDCSIIINCDKAFYNFNDPNEIAGFISYGYNSAKEHFLKRFTKQKIVLNSLGDKDIQI